jgi:DMSO reductase anchor subunit
MLLRQNFYIPILLAGAAGLGLVYNMAEVYRIPSAPGWNTWRTNASFLVSAILLGIAAMIPFLAYESGLTGIPIPRGQWMVSSFLVLVLLLVQFALMRSPIKVASIQATRMSFILIGAVLAAANIFASDRNIAMVSILMSVFVISQEVLGRWSFYRSRL